MKRLTVSISVFACALLLAPQPSEAQFGRIRDKVKETIEKKPAVPAEPKKPETTDKKATDKTDKTAAGQETSETTTTASPEKAAAMRPGEGAWANFDFVPGPRPIFVEDFTRDRVGNFPKRLTLENGNFEVVEWQAGRWLRAGGEGTYSVMLPEALPERWTMEFDLTIPWWSMQIYPGKVTAGLSEVQHVQFGVDSFAARANGGNSRTTFDPREVIDEKIFETASGEGSSLTRPVRVRFHQDGNYLKVYLDQVRVVNMPNMGRWQGNQINFHFHENTNQGKLQGALLTNLSINAGGKDMYDALTADGRLAIQGIYFDSGKDRIRPESSGTLREIADMLSEHGDLKLAIEGHTDNVGDAAANQKLSEARAAAVVAALTAAPYKVAAGRLTSVGLGPAKPAKPNDTPEGRQANRRVELVVQK